MPSEENSGFGIHDFVGELFGLCKVAADEIDSKDTLIAELKKSASGAPTPAKTQMFTLEEARQWTASMKQASVLPEEADLEKVARYIVDNPQWLVDQLLQTQLPPDPQGFAKEASTISDQAPLMDHDGWLSCLP